MRLPDELVHLQTDDLNAKLARLTPRQVTAIARIVASGYLTESPLCPHSLLTGDDPICTPEMFYRTGRYDETAQRWTQSPGWSRQPAFMEALGTAKRLAMRYNTDEEYIALRMTTRFARIASPNVMEDQIQIARSPGSDNKDRTAAAKLVLQYAAPDTIADTDHDNPEADWWKAAEETT